MKITHIVTGGILIAILYLIFNSFVIDVILQKNGRCANAYIYTETLPGRTAPNFKYRFFVSGNAYYGLLDKKENLKIGDSICIVYWRQIPNKNRPIKYFNDRHVACNCR